MNLGARESEPRSAKASMPPVPRGKYFLASSYEGCEGSPGSVNDTGKWAGYLWEKKEQAWLVADARATHLTAGWESR